MIASRLVLIVASFALAASMVAISSADPSTKKIVFPLPQVVALASAVPPQMTVCDPNTANQCATVSTATNLNVAVRNDPQMKLTDSGGTFTAGVDAQSNLQTKTCDPTTGTQCAGVDANGNLQTKVCDPTTSTHCAAVGTSGDFKVGGLGTAGSPSGGVVSVQGVTSGQALPVSGTVTVSGTVGISGQAEVVDGISKSALLATQGTCTTVKTGSGYFSKLINVSPTADGASQEVKVYDDTACTNAAKVIFDVEQIGAAHIFTIGEPVTSGISVSISSNGNLSGSGILVTFI